MTKKTSPDTKQYISDATQPVVPKQSINELDKMLSQMPADQKERLTEIKVVVEKFRDALLARLEGYIMGVSLLPPTPPELGPDGKPVADAKPSDDINVFVLVDDNGSQRMAKEQLQEKVEKTVLEVAEAIDKNLKPSTYIISQLWQQCYDGKMEVLQQLAMSATVYDNGMLSAIKISEVHKTMVLKKFEKYIVSYVLAGSLTQGRATPESDIDVFVVIDDTDVKKMTRVELRDKLRAIIVGMGAEAGEITGIRNKLNIQVYILTDFWESIKDANPTIFTFLRDGVPFYDRGVFMPWKQLLAMGRVKPSPEAIEMFMGSGNQFMERIYNKIRDIVMEDLFWALITPSQAALMMYGIPPTTPKETPEMMRELLVKKEGLLEEKHVKTVEKMLKYRKDLEHGKLKKVTGKEMDDLVTKSDAYLKRLDELFRSIEERKAEEKVLHMYETTMTIVRDALRLEGIESVTADKLSAVYDEMFITKGLLPQHTHRLLDQILKGKKDYDAKKLNKQEVSDVLKAAKELHRILIEFIQRKRGSEIDRARIRVKYGDAFGEVLVLDDVVFIIQNVDGEERTISRATHTKDGGFGPLQESNPEEFEEHVMQAKVPPQVFLKEKMFEDIKRIFGDDVHILMNM
jgi:predicted nucleotidyltransferase/uncharacterized protein (UPF0332 family)